MKSIEGNENLNNAKVFFLRMVKMKNKILLIASTDLEPDKRAFNIRIN